MTTGLLVHLPNRQNQIAARVREALHACGDSSEMMLYIQTHVPPLNPHLGAIKLDTYCDEGRSLFTVFVTGSYPGMPLTFQSRCLKSCYLRVAEHLCALGSARQVRSKAIQGIEPIYVRPLPEFQESP